MENRKYPRQIAEQLSQLRDLLIVIERADEKAPDVLYKLAIEKSQSITALVEEWRIEVGPPMVEVPAEYEVWADNYEQRMANDAHRRELQESDEGQNWTPEASQISIDEEHDMEQLPMGVFTFDEDIELPQLQEDDECNADAETVPAEIPEQQEPVAVEILTPEILEDDSHNETVQEVNAIDLIVMTEDDEEDEMVVLDEEMEVIEMEVATTEFCEGDIDDSSNEGAGSDNLMQEELIENDEEEEVDWYNRGEPFDSEPLTIGEKLSMHQARELRKALSLNDRFRFRRELFGNSDVTMNNTLNLIDTMADYGEACEYLLQDLGWSTSEPVVQEFLELVDRHFKHKAKNE